LTALLGLNVPTRLIKPEITHIGATNIQHKENSLLNIIKLVLKCKNVSVHGLSIKSPRKIIKNESAKPKTVQ